MLFASAFLALAVTGCNKQETSSTSAGYESTNTAATAEDSLRNAANTLKQEGKEAAATISDATQRAVDEVKDAAAGVRADAPKAEAEAESILNRAQAFFNEKRYEEALANLRQLSSTTLTPAQKARLEDLKREVQNALLKAGAGATNAVQKLDSLLGGRK